MLSQFQDPRASELSDTDQPLREALVLTDLGASPNAIGHLSDLFDQEYFERSWCIQEVVASNSCVGRCGDLEINFLDLLSTFPYVVERRVSMFSDKSLQFWNAISVWHPTAAPVWTRRGPGLVQGSVGSLLTILGMTRDFKDTDPRDKSFLPAWHL
jgi:hypothetical protein